jgi:hypothetical protein
MADQTAIDPSYNSHGIRTAPLVIGLGAAVRAEVTIFPYTSWCVRIIIFTCDQGKEAFYGADRMMDLDVGWMTNQVGNKYLRPDVHTYIPDVCSPPFWPFTKATSYGLDNVQDVMRLGTPTAARCFLLKSQVFTLRNRTSLKKRQAINVFRKLHHYTEYHKAVVNGQVTMVPYEAYKPVNVMILAYPLPDDGEIPIRLPPIIRPDPNLFHQYTEERVEGQSKGKGRSVSVEPNLAEMEDGIVDMSTEGHQISVDYQMAVINHRYDEENLRHMEEWMNNPANEELDIIEDGGFLRNLEQQKIHVEKLNTEITVQRLRLREYKKNVEIKWGHANRAEYAESSILPHHRGLRTPKEVAGREPEYGAQLLSEIGDSNRASTSTWKEAMDEFQTPENRDEENAQQRHVRLIKETEAKFSNMIFQGMDMNVTTRYWFKNVRKSLGMPFN